MRWHSQDGPDDLANAVTLRSLHHALFDCGVLGLSPGLQIAVSPPHGATSPAGRAIDALAASRHGTSGQVASAASATFDRWLREIINRAKVA